ncbi:MAG: PAS domain S-box protein [Terriglobales bacterium]
MTVRSVVEQMNPSCIDANESVAHRSSGPLRRIRLQHYGLAILSVGVALGTSLLLEHFHFRVPSALLLLFAVAISSWYAGAGPAVLAAILSTISFYWYFVEPVHTIYIYRSQIPYFVIFTAFAALLSRFGTFRQRAEADLRRTHDQLKVERPKLGSRTIALLYFAFSSCWILFTDRLVHGLGLSNAYLLKVSEAKGILFISLSTLLMYVLVEKALRQRHSVATAYWQLVETAQEGVWSVDAEGKTVFANENMAAILGTSPGEMIGKSILPFVPQEKKDELLNHLLQREQGLQEHYEFPFLRADGAQVWTLLRVSPVLRDGQHSGCLALVSDITKRKRAEEEVRNTAAQWQATFDAVQDLVLLLDKDFRVLRANHAAAEFLGLPFDKIVGGHCYDLIHGTFAPPAECPLAKMRQSRTHEEAEVLAKKGGPWLSVSVDPLFDPSGELTQVVHVARDITERKRAEEALRESETRFRTFVDHAGDALFVQDLGQGTIVDVNREACESLGYTRQELIGNTAVAFHLDSDRAEMESAAERAATGETVFDTHWHRRKDGSTFPVEVHTSLVSYGGRRFLLKVARDITDRLRAEEAIRQSERQLRDVIEGIPAIASTIRLDGSVEFINKRWQEYTGMSTEESVGLGWQSAGHPQDMGHYLEKRRAALASGHPFEDEARIRSRDGKYRWFLLRGAPLRDARGNIVRWYTTAIDIDDRKLAEEVRLEERVRERTRIARELHDTLLQSFHGTLFHFQAASNLLPTRTAEAKRMLDSAIDMAEQAITEGRDAIQGLRSPEVEINDLAVAIRTFGESYAADRGDDGSPAFQVELVGVARELDPTFAGEVYRIAIEALRNSFQHAEARHIKVEIRHEEKEFRVLVRDDGKGIDSKSLGAEGVKGHYGLHGMRERAKLIGSEIVIRSEVGAGTDVELRVAAITAYAPVASS